MILDDNINYIIVGFYSTVLYTFSIIAKDLVEIVGVPAVWVKQNSLLFGARSSDSQQRSELSQITAVQEEGINGRTMKFA